MDLYSTWFGLLLQKNQGLGSGSSSGSPSSWWYTLFAYTSGQYQLRDSTCVFLASCALLFLLLLDLTCILEILVLPKISAMFLHFLKINGNVSMKKCCIILIDQ